MTSEAPVAKLAAEIRQDAASWQAPQARGCLSEATKLQPPGQRLSRRLSLPSLHRAAEQPVEQAGLSPLCVPRLGLMYVGLLRDLGPGGPLGRPHSEVTGNAEVATACQYQQPLDSSETDVGVEYLATTLAKLGGIFTPAANLVSMSMTLGNVVAHEQRNEQVDVARSTLSLAMDSISLGLWLGSAAFPPLAIAAMSVSAVDFGVGLYLDGTADLVADGEQ